jgi:hypothetical protein
VVVRTGSSCFTETGGYFGTTYQFVLGRRMVILHDGPAAIFMVAGQLVGWLLTEALLDSPWRRVLAWRLDRAMPAGYKKAGWHAGPLQITNDHGNDA